jgi:threonine aldolase
MGNLIAVMAHTKPGDQIIVDAASHILWSEEWAVASVCGVLPRAIETDAGAPDPDDVDAAIRASHAGHRPRTALLCLENTHNAAGGTIVGTEQTALLARLAHEHGAAVHLDGARVFNAAVALAMDVGELVNSVDSVMINLNKGLSAPFGALLCGSAAFVADARALLRRLGGASIHQAGLFAAAGIVALERMVDRLGRDHERARTLAALLDGIDGIDVDLGLVQTNIVMARVGAGLGSATELHDHLRSHGVGSLVYGDRVLRFVVHRHVTGRAVARVESVTRDACGRAPRES